MKKKLIEVRNLDSFICKESGTINVDKCMLLTPGAKDELRRRKIRIVHVADAYAEAHAADVHEADGCGNANCTKEKCDGCESLVMGIAVLLKEEYGITDMAQLKELSFSIAEAVKAHI
ncbi:hypothetical protein [Maridesulfovibrio sp. FT414]|uniref:hypothetical protein n=1 Tax=Maridesulfovibrio sp. FT414 TaxID=2979469 RepID=UPI003D8067B9